MQNYTISPFYQKNFVSKNFLTYTLVEYNVGNVVYDNI